MCRVRSRPDILSAVTAKADDALGRDAFLSFRSVLTGLYPEFEIYNITSWHPILEYYSTTRTSVLRQTDVRVVEHM